MIIREWPEMLMVTADRIQKGDVITGLRTELRFSTIELLEDWFTVTDVKPEQYTGAIRIEGHESDMVPGFHLWTHRDHVIIVKGGKS